MIYHVEERVLGGEAQVLALVCAVFAHVDSGRGEKAAGGCHLGTGEVVVPEELQVLDAPSGGLALPEPESQVDARSHLYGRPTGLAVSLGVVHVPGRDQGALGVHRQQDSGPRRELLYIYVPGRLARWDGP